MKAHHGAEPSDVFETAWDVFRRVVENCPVGIFTADDSGRHVFVNRHWSVLTGVPRDKAVGRGWERAVHPEDVRAVTRRWRQLVTEGDELTVQIRLLRPDGTARPAILRAAAVVGENGHRRFAGTLSALTDTGQAGRTSRPDPATGTGAGADRLVSSHGPAAHPAGFHAADPATPESGPAGSRPAIPPPASSEAPGGDAAGDDVASVDVAGGEAAEGEATAGVSGAGQAEPQAGTIAPVVGDGLDAAYPDTVELLREELDRFDLVTDDLWFPPDEAVDQPGQGWTVPAPRRPSAAEVEPPSLDPGDPRRHGASGHPFGDAPFTGLPAGDASFADTPFAESPFIDRPFGDRPFATPPREPARGWFPERTRPGPSAAAGQDSGDPRFAGEDGRLPAPRSGAGSHRGGALPPGAEWRAAVSPHSTIGGPQPPPPPKPSTGRMSFPGAEPADPLAPRPAASRSDHGHTGPWSGHSYGHGTQHDGDCGCAFSEIRRLADACHERERWLTALLAELPSAVLVADTDARVVAVNQTYCDLFDLSEAPVDLVGADCRAHIRPVPGLVEDPAGFAHRLDTHLRRRRTIRREAVMFADGRVFERSHIPLAGPEGYHGHVWLYVDVTDRRIVEAEIEGLISGL